MLGIVDIRKIRDNWAGWLGELDLIPRIVRRWPLQDYRDSGIDPRPIIPSEVLGKPNARRAAHSRRTQMATGFFFGPCAKFISDRSGLF